MALVRTRNPSRYKAASAGGGGTVDWDAKYTTAIDANNTGDTYWVTTTGSNGNSGADVDNGFADILYAVQQMSGGDELIVADGTYTDNISMRANDNTSLGGGQTIPNGVSHTQRTIIRAENPFGVIIEFNSGSTNLTAEGNPFRLETATYVWVDGFIVRMFGNYSNNSGDPSTCFWINSDNNTITRCGARKNTNTDFGGGFSLTGDDVLAQDIFGCGATRYGIQGGGGLSSTQQNSIFRRCLWRFDFDQTSDPQPHASIAYYGSSSNSNGDHEFQNCIAIDGKKHEEFSNSTDVYGGIYSTHSPTDVKYRGCIVLNNEARFAGIYLGEVGADDMDVVDCLILNDGGGADTPYAISAASSVTNQSTTNVTVGNFDGGTYSANVTTPTNDLVLPDTPDSENPLVRVAGDGCEIKDCIGTFMSRYGDTDYTVAQSDLPLWPYPYEDEIKTEMAIAMATPSGYTPASNDSDRGFCASGQNLTKYIHEFRGATLNLTSFYS